MSFKKITLLCLGLSILSLILNLRKIRYYFVNREITSFFIFLSDNLVPVILIIFFFILYKKQAEK